MKLPPFNVLLGLILVGFAVYQPMVILNSTQAVLDPAVSGPAWSLFIWGGICILLGIYGRKSREYVGPAVLIALTPIIKKELVDASLVEHHIKGAVTSFGMGAFLAWAGAIVILFAAYGKVSSDPADKKDV
jgi:hypothetical protein